MSVGHRKGKRVRGRAVAVLALVLIAVGCITTPANFRARNRGRMNLLSIGLSKREVLEIMGTRNMWVCTYGPACVVLPMLYMERATNPHRTETAKASDGTALEIYFYQTDTRTADGATTDDELSPLVFENGRLAGWGWTFLRQNAERYQISVR
jgi:hypothetical protein